MRLTRLWPPVLTLDPSSVSCSPEGSSVDRPTPQEVATQLWGYIQRLRERCALVKIPPKPGPTLAPMPTVPHAEALVQAILGTQPGPALPRLEKMQIQRDLAATRVHVGSGHCVSLSGGTKPFAEVERDVFGRLSNKGEFYLAGGRLPGGRRIGTGILRVEEEFVFRNSISHKILNLAFQNFLPVERRWRQGT